MSERTERVAEWLRDRGYFVRPDNAFEPDGLRVSLPPISTPAGPYGSVPILENAFRIVPRGSGWSIVVSHFGGELERFEFDESDPMLAAAVARLESPPGRHNSPL